MADNEGNVADANDEEASLEKVPEVPDVLNPSEIADNGKLNPSLFEENPEDDIPLVSPNEVNEVQVVPMNYARVKTRCMPLQDEIGTIV